MTTIRAYTVKQTPEFGQWLSGIKDGLTRIRLARRLDKAQRGLLGDVAPVGEGVFEMREFFGPGWRTLKPWNLEHEQSQQRRFPA